MCKKINKITLNKALSKTNAGFSEYEGNNRMN